MFILSETSQNRYNLKVLSCQHTHHAYNECMLSFQDILHMYVHDCMPDKALNGNFDQELLGDAAWGRISALI